MHKQKKWLTLWCCDLTTYRKKEALQVLATGLLKSPNFEIRRRSMRQHD